MTLGPLLAVDGLRTTFSSDQGEVVAVDGLTFHVERGEVLGLVGESGCGKSAAALSIMGLLPSPQGRVAGGTVKLDGTNLLTLRPGEMDKIRGSRVAMVFQEPMTSLNPVLTIGDQIVETVRRHLGLGRRAARSHAIGMLSKVRIANPERYLGDYPHQLSGGMRQRVMIAMAIACNPKVLLADEPTTALDVTIQAQILILLRELQAEFQMAIVLITHDMGVVAQFADRVMVMYAGRAVECAGVKDIFARPTHPYTRGLLDSVPRIDARTASMRLKAIAGSVPAHHEMPPGCRFAPRCDFRAPKCEVRLPPLLELEPGRAVACARHEEIGLWQPQSRQAPEIASPGAASAKPILVRVRGLTKHFPLRRPHLLARVPGHVRAVDGLDFTVHRGETLGLVGESGCGKSTTGWLLLRLLHPTSGSVEFDGIDITALSAALLRPHRRRMQIIFQDPYGALDPRMTVGDIVSEPLRIMGERDSRTLTGAVRGILDKVGLAAHHIDRYPHEFSGGQRQRISIGRALILRPSLVVCDEAVSALDVSVQAQVVNLLQDLQQEMGLTYLFISHDLGVVKHICDRVAVMYLGKIVELADKNSLFASPLHPYTLCLLQAIPAPDPRARRARPAITGDVPDPANPPAGCRFHTRCPQAIERCRVDEPALRLSPQGHFVACHLVDGRLSEEPIH